MTTAFRASEYLESLLKSGAIIPKGDTKLDLFYPEVGSIKGGSGQPELLLSRDVVPKIQQAFNLSGSFSRDLSRALAQAKLRLKTHETTNDGKS